ncbi:hypothetical protein F4778DRAFT_75678 [Xylariomycetidae sp. FL2044]|nr:hypothetical protein F4778DRAFT_75678 [Xylariomycetidae sp. FL2044]
MSICLHKSRGFFLLLFFFAFSLSVPSAFFLSTSHLEIFTFICQPLLYRISISSDSETPRNMDQPEKQPTHPVSRPNSDRDTVFLCDGQGRYDDTKGISYYQRDFQELFNTTGYSTVSPKAVYVVVSGRRGSDEYDWSLALGDSEGLGHCYFYKPKNPEPFDKPFKFPPEFPPECKEILVMCELKHKLLPEEAQNLDKQLEDSGIKLSKCTDTKDCMEKVLDYLISTGLLTEAQSRGITGGQLVDGAEAVAKYYYKTNFGTEYVTVAKLKVPSTGR